jgi:hypothetical protein
LVQIGPDWSKMVQTRPKWLKLVQNGSNLFRMDQLGSNLKVVLLVNGGILVEGAVVGQPQDLLKKNKDDIIEASEVIF